MRNFEPVALAVVLIEAIGITGAAWSVGISYAVYVAAHTWLCHVVSLVDWGLGLGLGLPSFGAVLLLTRETSPLSCASSRGL